MKQQGLFDEFNYNDYSDKLGQPQKKGSRNDIFTDYDSFVAKFSKEAPKTTDDCFTPPAVYQAVLDWLGTKVDLTGKDIIRPILRFLTCQPLKSFPQIGTLHGSFLYILTGQI